MRTNPRPVFLEFKTYRYHGHGAADEAKQTVYRTKEEIEEAKRTRDPLMIAEKILREKGAITDAEVAQIRTEALAAAEAALKFSDESPNPAPDELLKDVYA
jgi:pyruvate dehydrogenase E1 component alpha subunit